MARSLTCVFGTARLIASQLVILPDLFLSSVPVNKCEDKPSLNTLVRGIDFRRGYGT